MKMIRGAWVAVALVLGSIGVNAVEEGTDDAKLAAALAQAREQRLADLHEYADKGIFPHNHGHPGERVPYFMDRHGRLCAVGYLIAKSKAGEEWDYDRFMAKKNVARTYSSVGLIMPGDKERRRKAEEADARLVKLLGFFNDVATANNNVRIKDVHTGKIMDWILRSGLTQEEAALIQPGYSHLACDDCLPGSEARSVSFGRQTQDSKDVEAEDRFRIREHLRAVEQKLRDDTPESLKTCAARLKGRGPVKAWMMRTLDL